jgi:hypothetical protein
LRVDKPITDAELERLHELLEDGLGSHARGGSRGAVARGMTETARASSKSSTARARAASLDVGERTARGRSGHRGQALLLDQPEFGNVDQLRDLLLALEARERLVGSSTERSLPIASGVPRRKRRAPSGIRERRGGALPRARGRPVPSASSDRRAWITRSSCLSSRPPPKP